MRKLLTLCAALLLAATSVKAQWKPSYTDFTVLGTDSVYGQGGLKTLRTPEGNIVLTWVNHPKDISYKDANYGYYLYMQIFDPQGNALFGKDGKTIVGKHTFSWYGDYGLTLSSDGNILIGYTDARNNESKSASNNFFYCYKQDGTSVWSEDGILFESVAEHPGARDMEPSVMASDGNIYASIMHTESYNVKADSTNWQPSEWFPDEEMPDSVLMSSSNYQVMRLNADGSKVWDAPIILDRDYLWMYPAPDGNAYLVYPNNGYGVDVRCIDKDGKDVWSEPVNAISEQIGTSSYTEKPAIESDGKGGLIFAYRALINYSGYLALQHLYADGTVWSESLNANGTMDGNATNPEIAVKGEKTFVAWSYDNVAGSKDLMVNQIDNECDYTLEGDSLLGYALDNNEMWGLTAVKVIPRTDGWVVLYGNSQSWNGANFYACKIGDDGKVAWKKQIAEDDFKASGFSVVYDDQNAYIFYTCDVEYDDNWEEIPGEGGMRMFCIDLNGDTDNIANIKTNENQNTVIYNAQGMQVTNTNAPGMYIIKQNGTTKKVVKK